MKKRRYTTINAVHKREAKQRLSALREKEKELYCWLLNNPSSDPQWQSKVSEFHATGVSIEAMKGAM